MPTTYDPSPVVFTKTVACVRTSIEIPDGSGGTINIGDFECAGGDLTFLPSFGLVNAFSIKQGDLANVSSALTDAKAALDSPDGSPEKVIGINPASESYPDLVLNGAQTAYSWGSLYTSLNSAALQGLIDAVNLVLAEL